MRLADNQDLPETDGLGWALALAALGVIVGVLAIYAIGPDTTAEPNAPDAIYVGQGAECPPYSVAPYADGDGWCWAD